MPRIIRVPKTLQRKADKRKALVPYLEQAYLDRQKNLKKQLKDRPPGHRPVTRLVTQDKD